MGLSEALKRQLLYDISGSCGSTVAYKMESVLDRFNDVLGVEGLGLMGVTTDTRVAKKIRTLWLKYQKKAGKEKRITRVKSGNVRKRSSRGRSAARRSYRRRSTSQRRRSGSRSTRRRH